MPTNIYIRLRNELKIANNQYMEGFYSIEELEIVLNEITFVYQHVISSNEEEQFLEFFNNLLTG